MSPLAVLALLASPPQGTIEIREALSIRGVARGGRVPVSADAVLARLIQNPAYSPNAGDTIGEAMWRGTTANAEGFFEAPGGGYLFATVQSTSDRTMLLEATGHGMVYANGAPRAGDPYGYGYFRVPVRLRTGQNTFFFANGRGRLKARLVEPSATYQIESADATLPDIIPSDTGRGIGGVTVLNSASSDATNLTLVVSAGRKVIKTKLPRVPASGLRKVRFEFDNVAARASKGVLDLALLANGRAVHSARFELRVLRAGQVHKRTFVSGIDGSVQYYAVNPATQPSRKNALVLSLHGASVEATNQAQAYKSKSWATIVAPTNRRPYGFDWEDWGRLDALEVLAHASKRIAHDPKRVVLTGHSMGGHGTWSIGTLFPDQFAAIAPSAGWVSFWSYGGGWNPSEPSAAETVMRQAMSPSDTLARINNTRTQRVFVLHGDADDNVPVDQARTMRRELADLHPNLGYHEEKGAGHWFGDESVDFPALMATLEAARLGDFREIDFTTPDPSVSARYGWVEVLQQLEPLMMSRVQGEPSALATKNIRAMRVSRDLKSVSVDGQALSNVPAGSTLVRQDGRWKVATLGQNEKRPGRSGPLKQAFTRRFVLVFGTAGSPEENRWMRDKARFDAETFAYRGNGAPDVVSDVEYLKRPAEPRNVIVYGNANANRAWRQLLAGSPVQAEGGRVTVGKTTFGAGHAVLVVRPSVGETLVAGIGGSDLAGMRITERLPIFVSGVAYPDWTVLGPNAPEVGTKSVVSAGFFDHAWRIVTR